MSLGAIGVEPAKHADIIPPQGDRRFYMASTTVAAENGLLLEASDRRAAAFAAAEDLVPLLRGRAIETDSERRVADDSYRRLVDAGLFQVLKPKEFGGAELSDYDHARITVKLAEGCASTAWVYSVVASLTTVINSYPLEAQEEVWSSNPNATLSGNTTLNPAAHVERAEGGYLLTGQWGFCSGSDFTEWIIFNAPVGPDGEGHMFLVPASATSVVDDWFPTGMRGTGSRSRAVEKVFVPDHRVQPTRDIVNNLEERRALHPTFDALWAPWPSHGRFTFAAVAVGAAYGAAKQFIESASSATRMASSIGGRVRLVDQDYVATEVADIFGELEAALMVIERRSLIASERAHRRELSVEADLAQEDRDNALVTRIALRSVQRLAYLVGSKAGFPEHYASRALRDVDVISHHVSLNWRQASIRFLKSRVEWEPRTKGCVDYCIAEA